MPVAPTGFASKTQAFYPRVGQGTYIGLRPGYPGSNAVFPYAGQGYGGGGAQVSDAGLVIQVDGNQGAAISTLSAAPQNVLRLTGAFGVGYIQGSNIGFALPFSGNAGVRVLPGTNQINAQNLVFVSTIRPLASNGVGVAGQINMTQLTSTIQGYGWAQVIPG